jgi:PTS system nitrogen regulatory IIA component
MNDIPEILTVERVEAAMTAPNKKGLFNQLAVAAGRRTGLDPKALAAALLEREKLGSTGFGGGAAIPHARVEGLSGVFGYFARLTTAVEFQSVDNIPVDLVFLILSPPDAGADHLKALAGVSRVLRDRNVAAKLRGARSRDAIFALLSGVESRDAA